MPKTVTIDGVVHEVKEKARPRTHSEHEAWERKQGKKSFQILPDDAHRKRKRRNVTLSPRALAIAKKLAEGNVSRGIERALFHFDDCPEAAARKRK